MGGLLVSEQFASGLYLHLGCVTADLELSILHQPEVLAHGRCMRGVPFPESTT